MATQLEVAAFEAVERIKDARDQAQIRNELLSYIAAFGLDSFIITELPPIGFDFAAHIKLSAWPAIWHQRYTVLKHYDHDPVARHACATLLPFVWSVALREQHISKDEQRIMDEASDYGLADGVMVPLHTVSGLASCVSFAGPHVELPPRAVDAIYLVAIHAFATAEELAAHSVTHNRIDTKTSELKPTPRLTPREREIMGWVARGRTDREISMICNISPKTVAHHVSNATAKLGALNRTHAAVDALLCGAIRATDLPSA